MVSTNDLFFIESVSAFSLETGCLQLKMFLSAKIFSDVSSFKDV